MTGLPLASAQCHGASSTVTWMWPIRGATASADSSKDGDNAQVLGAVFNEQHAAR